MTAAQTRMFLTAFPFAFIGLWLTVTTVLGVVSGWRSLQDRYPARDDPPLLTLRSQSGRLGGVSYNGCLTLKACPGGLRVSVWKLFAPFQHAIEVPWDEIRPEPPRGWPLKRVRLHFGSPELQMSEVRATSWDRLIAAAGSGPQSRFALR